MLFAKYNIKTTWFIPGHSLETFPKECAMIRDAGHEMYGCYTTQLKITMLKKNIRRGLHGYSHENPVKMSIEQQKAILDKTYKDLTKFCGKPPRGNVCNLGPHVSFRSNFYVLRYILECRDRVKMKLQDRQG